MESQDAKFNADEPLPRRLSEIRDARLSRVIDYQAISLKKNDALEANLGSINSGLMRIAVSLDETIEQAIESAPRTLDRAQRILPAIETHLRVARQIDRFAQIEVRAAESRKRRPSDDDATTRRLELASDQSSSDDVDSESEDPEN